MAWEKVPERNKELLAKVPDLIPESEPRMMFGCPVYFLKGNMFVGAHQNEIFIRLNEQDRNHLINEAGGLHFSPNEKMTMKEYVVLPSSIYESDTEFSKWLTLSKEYTEGLPPKVKKSKVKK